MGGDGPGGVHRLRGAIDADVFFVMRDAFVRHAPRTTASVDDLANPTVLTVEWTEGLQGEAGRFDVQWTTERDYKFHYTEPGLDFRWGHHPHGGAYDVPGNAHFHPPPVASSDPDAVEPSCFTLHRPRLLVRGVLRNVRAASHDGLNELNRGEYTP